MKLFDCFSIFNLSQECEIILAESGYVLYKGVIAKIPITYGMDEIVSTGVKDDTVIFKISGL